MNRFVLLTLYCYIAVLHYFLFGYSGATFDKVMMYFFAGMTVLVIGVAFGQWLLKGTKHG